MRKNKLLICAVSAIMLAAFGCGSSKDTVEDTITVVDSTVKNDSNKAELNTTISFEEKHNEIEQTTVETTETTELTMAVTIVTTDQTIVETTEKIVQIEQATIANKKQPVKQTTTKNNNQNNLATTSEKNPVKEEQTTANKEQQVNNETKEKQALAKTKIKKLMPSIVKASMTELQKVIAIHDWIVINMNYAYNDYKNGTVKKDAHTAYGGLESGYVVCNGYVELFSMMAEEVGIETKRISGYGNTGLGDQHHSWSQVKIDGKWYNLDLTWDDPTWNNKEHDDNLHNSYNFFLLSDAEFYKTHRPYKEGEYYTEKPSTCTSSISIPDIINASATKRAAYFTNINDMARFKKDIENIAKTDVEFFAVYCMNGDGEKNKRTIDSIVVKTLKPYENSGSELSNDGYDIWFYERKDNILTATNEAECIAMIKKGIEAKKKGQEVIMRCVNEIFADDKENYNGDIYYNKESDICEAKVYRWTAKAGIQEAISCILGDGYTYIMIGDFNDGRKLIVADSPEKALVMIKEYIDTFENEMEPDMRVICVGDSLVPDHRNEIWLSHYLEENDFLMGYDLDITSEYDLGQSVYMCVSVKVQYRPRIHDFASLKSYMEKCETDGNNIQAYFYDSNITKDNYSDYMKGLYVNIGSGNIYYRTYFIRDGLVYIE